MTVTSNAPLGQEPIAQAARIWAENGFSVVPIRADGTKRPAVEWRLRQSEALSPQNAEAIFSNYPGMGIGIVCGRVSGNAEMTELEGRATTEDTLVAIGDACDRLGVGDTLAQLFNDGYTEYTPSGGIHLIYRISDHDVPGNTKIARRPATPEELAAKPDDKAKVLAETRGEGGYVIVAPTGGRVHPSGARWEVLAGQIGHVPTITWEQRNLIHQAIAEALDQMPEPQAPSRPPVPASQPLNGGASANRPGDDFNERAEWVDIIGGTIGWTINHTGGDTVYWTRPGKDRRDGHSATTGRAGTGSQDRLYVMSSATDLPTEQPLSKFYVYAHYHHHGDLAAATRDLARQGYGDQTPRFQRPDYDGAWSNVDSPVTKTSPSNPFQFDKPKGVHDYTQSGAVVRFIDEWGRYIRYVTEEKAWRTWNGIYWEQDLNGARVSQCFEAMTEKMYAEAHAMADDDPMKKGYTAHVRRLRDSGRSAIMSLIASWTSCSASEFDANPQYLNLLNGVYDVVADQFIDHDPKYMLTKVANFSYDPEEKAPKSEAFLAELLPSEQMREFTMQALAYSLTGEADRKALFILQGIPNSGKTQITEMAATLFGDYAVSVSPGTFTKRREHGPNPELHNMRGARFVYTSETSYEIQLDEELVKRVTGKDTMSTRTLYERPQQWVPQCTVWIATNNLPRFGSDSDAMWKRVKTVRFVNEFTDDGSSGHLAQPNIGRTLAAEESAGLFNLLLKALRRYRAAGKLAEPPELKESVAAHREETDPLLQWLSDIKESGQLTSEPGAEADQAILLRSYAHWCEDQGYTALGAQRFGNAMTANLRCTKRRSNGRTLLVGWKFTGLTWASSGFFDRQQE